MSKKNENILGKPKIDQIKARIGVLEKHFGRSGNQLGLDAKLGNTTVDGWTDNQIGKPSLAVKEFLKHYNIREEWWKTGEEPVFITYVESPSNKNDMEFDPDQAIKAFLEKNPDYRIIPKTILDGEYRIMLESEIEERKKVYREAIDSKNKLIKQLEREISDLRGEKGLTEGSVTSTVPMASEEGK